MRSKNYRLSWERCNLITHTCSRSLAWETKAWTTKLPHWWDESSNRDFLKIFVNISLYKLSGLTARITCRFGKLKIIKFTNSYYLERNSTIKKVHILQHTTLTTMCDYPKFWTPSHNWSLSIYYSIKKIIYKIKNQMHRTCNPMEAEMLLLPWNSLLRYVTSGVKCVTNQIVE